MKRKRFSAEQIVAVVKQAEVGVPVAALRLRIREIAQTRVRYGYRVFGGGNTNDSRPHRSLGEPSPSEFACQIALNGGLPSSQAAEKLTRVCNRLHFAI